MCAISNIRKSGVIFGMVGIGDVCMQKTYTH